MSVQVDAFGFINLVHQPYNRNGVLQDAFDPDSANQFSVHWEEDRWPTAATGCGSDCTVRGTTCLCQPISSDAVAVTQLQGVTSASLLASLRIGSAPPAAFDTNSYTRCTTAACSSLVGVDVYLRGTSAVAALGIDTIFELTREDGKINF